LNVFGGETCRENDGRGMMNDELKAARPSSFITPHSAFIISLRRLPSACLAVIFHLKQKT
jgi:hypothetical protein